MPSIDPKKIAHWKSLSDSATPGPWLIDEAGTEVELEPLGVMARFWSTEIIAPAPGAEQRFPEAESLVLAEWRRPPDEDAPQGANADRQLMAAAREAVPAFLAEREELLALLRKVEARRDQPRDEMDDSCVECREIGGAAFHAPGCRLDAFLRPA